MKSTVPMPASQSQTTDVDTPENSQQSRGIKNKRLRRQQLVMMQAKFLPWGCATSKSPPAPTYLYVVSWMYSPWPVPTYERPPLPSPPPPHPTPQAVISSPAPTPQTPPLPAAPRSPPAYPPA